MQKVYISHLFMRDERIDFYKGILMYGVVWGHLCTILLTGMDSEMTLHTLVRTYDMPFFMLLSGLFLAKSCNKYSFSRLLLDKTTTILMPSLLWSLIFSRLQSLTIYYFLLSVFFCSVIMIVINRIGNTQNLKVMLALLVAVLLHCIDATLCNMPYLFPFFAIGFFLKKIPQGNMFVFVIYLGLWCFWRTDYTIWSLGACVLHQNVAFYLQCLLRFSIGLAGIFMAKTVMDIVYDYVNKQFPNNFLFRLVIKEGRYTLAIYILQNVFIFMIIKIIIIHLLQSNLSNILLQNMRFTAYILGTILCLTIIWLSVALVEWCNGKKYLRWLWGIKINMKSLTDN